MSVARGFGVRMVRDWYASCMRAGASWRELHCPDEKGHENGMKDEC